MSAMRPFRFGVQGDTPPGEWIAHAKRAELLGYDVLSVGEHVLTELAPLPALMAAAMATSTIRLGTATLANDFHHPVILARDIATLDALSGGRLEFGLGSGYLYLDYDQLGIPLETPGVRIERLFEAVQLIRAAFGGENIDFSGDYYHASGLTLIPKPPRLPGPPLMIGGGSRRLLEFAGRHADIVSINTRTTAAGWFDWSSIGADAMAEKISWVRNAAGDRFEDIELQILVIRLETTHDPEAVANSVISYFEGYGPIDLKAVDILESPFFLTGTEEEIVEMILRRREEYGISYLTVFTPAMEEFAPIARRLRDV